MLIERDHTLSCSLMMHERASRAMDDLKQSVQDSHLEQKEPLVII